MHAMRKLIILLSALVYVIHAQAQFSVTAHQEGWNNIPPQVQKPGFSFQQSVLANMDGDRKSTRLNSSHASKSRMPSSA